MQRIAPPFRADHVGSLLRPPDVKAARAQHGIGAITTEELRRVEDRAIERLIAKQAEIGLRTATDGELRRGMWHFDFLEKLEGCQPHAPDSGIVFKGVVSKPRGVRVVGKLGFSGRHPMLEHFRFLREHAGSAMPKMTIPSPSVLHFRGGRKAISETIYPDLVEFYRDLGETYRCAVQAFAQAGCRYLQLDETNLAYLCDDEQRRMVQERGEDPNQIAATYAQMINAAVEGAAGMAVTMHLCRGNYRSSWIAEGGYEPVADLLFNQIRVDGYFMEYDTERAGSFEPLRLVPKDKTVVLGLVTSKTGRLEPKDEIKRRIDEAARYIDPDQLCLSPQCGFASTEEGNVLTEDEQWAKLARVVDIADDVWGGV